MLVTMKPTTKYLLESFKMRSDAIWSSAFATSYGSPGRCVLAEIDMRDAIAKELRDERRENRERKMKQ